MAHGLGTSDEAAVTGKAEDGASQRVGSRGPDEAAALSVVDRDASILLTDILLELREIRALMISIATR